MGLYFNKTLAFRKLNLKVCVPYDLISMKQDKI